MQGSTPDSHNILLRLWCTTVLQLIKDLEKSLKEMWNERDQYRHRGIFTTNGKSQIWICAILSPCHISWPAVDP